MDKKHTGHCACGQVTYAFDTDPSFIADCHCTDCKRTSGGEMATFVAVPDTDFTFSGSTRSFSYGRTPILTRSRRRGAGGTMPNAALDGGLARRAMRRTGVERDATLRAAGAR